MTWTATDAEGNEYDIADGVLTIPAGAATAVITVTATDADGNKAEATVNVTAADDSGDPSDPVATGIEVTAADGATTILQSGILQFTATLTGGADFTEVETTDVTWTATDATDTAKTYTISADGLLDLSGEATQPDADAKIKVTATAKTATDANGDLLTGEVTITVKAEAILADVEAAMTAPVALVTTDNQAAAEKKIAEAAEKAAGQDLPEGWSVTFAVTDGTWTALDTTTDKLNGKFTVTQDGSTVATKTGDAKDVSVTVTAAPAAAPNITSAAGETEVGSTVLSGFEADKTYEYVLDTSATLADASTASWADWTADATTKAFSAIEVGSNTYIHVRVKADGTTPASQIKDVLLVLKTNEAAAAPNITSAAGETEEGSTVLSGFTSGTVYQYVLDTNATVADAEAASWTDWTADATTKVFSATEVGSNTYIHVRVKADGTTPASQIKDVLLVKKTS